VYDVTKFMLQAMTYRPDQIRAICFFPSHMICADSVNMALFRLVEPLELDYASEFPSKVGKIHRIRAGIRPSEFLLAGDRGLLLGFVDHDENRIRTYKIVLKHFYCVDATVCGESDIMALVASEHNQLMSLKFYKVAYEDSQTTHVQSLPICESNQTFFQMFKVANLLVMMSQSGLIAMDPVTGQLVEFCQEAKAAPDLDSYYTVKQDKEKVSIMILCGHERLNFMMRLDYGYFSNSVH